MKLRKLFAGIAAAATLLAGMAYQCSGGTSRGCDVYFHG